MLRKCFVFFMVAASLVVLVLSCDSSGVKNSWAQLYAMGDYYLEPIRQNSFKQLSDGGYIAGLIVLNYPGTRTLNVVKLDVNGSIVWQKYIDSYVQNDPVVMAMSKDEDIVVGQIYGRYNAAGEKGFKLIKLDGDGELAWEKKFSYDFYLTEFLDIDIDPVNDMIYILGKKLGVSDNYPRDFLLAKVDINGNEIYSKIINSGNEDDYYPGNYRDSDFFVKSANDGGCLVVFHGKVGSVSSEWFTGYHPVILKLSPAGTRVWSRSYMISGGVSAIAADDPVQLSRIACTADGGYLAVGKIPWLNNVFNNHRVMPVFKLSPDGEVLKSAELYVMKQAATAVSGTVDDCRGAKPVSVSETSDGGYAILGEITDYPYANYPFASYEAVRTSAFIVKFDTGWNITWQKEYKEKAISYTQVPGDPQGYISSTFVEQELSPMNFCEVPAGGFTMVGDLNKHELIAPFKDIANGTRISYVLKTTAKGSVANTELIIDAIKGKVGSISAVSADRSCGMADIAASVSDAGGAFTDSLIKAYAY